jgi:hyperosmotically inducible periplasmic protein
MRNQKHLIVMGLVALVATFVLAGCSTTVSADRQIADSEITASVKTRLAADPDVAAINIDVDTLEGTVTLSGRVKTDKERQEALEIARGTEHVRKVVDNLKVGDHS